MTVSKNIIAVALAAGQGTRMKSSTPKVLHTLAHLPLVQHVSRLLDALECEKRILVTAPDMEDVRSEVDTFTHAIQDKALGTGHAVLAAADHMTGTDDVLVLYGDTPLVTAETVQAMIQEKQDAGADMAVLGMRLENPGHYGRLVGNAEGFVEIPFNINGYLTLSSFDFFSPRQILFVLLCRLS